MVTNQADVSTLRAQFPALASGFTFLENAGGSQVPASVADAIRDYMLTSYVQLGAGYEASVRATEIVAQAHDFINEFMNGSKIGQAVLGPSSTQLITMLAECYSRLLEPGDEIVVAEMGHEANIGPWSKLQSRGFKIRTWRVNPETTSSDLSALQKVLSENTRIVAFTHVSNLLGEILDAKAVADLAHQAGARVVVDGVAYAPHRAIDVAAIDADWYVYSAYKVFGPHMAGLYGKHEAFAEIKGPNHFFLPESDAYKFELGGVSHEGCAGLLALRPYLNLLAGSSGEVTHSTVSAAFEAATELELPLQKRLIEWLSSKPDVKIAGPASWGRERVPTVSFTHSRLSPAEVVSITDGNRIGIRWGHMYAYRLCQALGIDVNKGVVRISAAHYNTMEEIDRLIAVLDPHL